MKTPTLLLASTLLASGAEFEDFKEFHVPAKHTLDTGQSLLFDGVIVDGKPVRMNPHIMFQSTDGLDNNGWITSPMWVIGEQPPGILQQSIQCTGTYAPMIWMYFDVPVMKVSFDVRAIDPTQGWLGLIAPYLNMGDAVYGLNQEAFLHVEWTFTVPFGVLIVGAEGPVAITNVQIEEVQP